MRRSAGASDIVVPIGLAATPAGAAGGNPVRTSSGSPTFTPTFPKLGSKFFVLSAVTSNGANIGGRVGGGVSRATGSVTAVFSTRGAGTTLPAKASIPTDGAEAGDAKQTSAVAATSTARSGATATDATPTGTLVAGVFKGLKLSGSVISAIPAGACQRTALSKVTFKQLTALVIT